MNRFRSRRFTRWCPFVPAGLLGMIGLIVLCEIFLAHRTRDFMGESVVSWSWGAKSARHDAAKAEILCLGDSTVKFGVASRVIERQTG